MPPRGPRQRSDRRRRRRLRPRTAGRLRLAALIGVLVAGTWVTLAATQPAAPHARRVTSAADPGPPLPPPGGGGSQVVIPITIGWAGDTVPASSDRRLPASPDLLFASVRRAMHRPDVMILNLEGTLTTRGVSKCAAPSTNCYAFRSPPSYAFALQRAGVVVANMANNHALDFGPIGRADTVSALTRAHVAHDGGPGDVAIVPVRGVDVAAVGFSSYAWTGPMNDPAAERLLIRRAASMAAVVVVVLHGGAEGAGAQHVPYGHQYYLGEDRGDLRSFARTAIDAGASLVVGSGPHVLRGMQFYRHHLIVYSAGNFVGYGGVLGINGATATSMIVTATLGAHGRLLEGRIIPIRVGSDGIPRQDPSGAAIGLVRSLSRQDFGAGAARISRAGRIGRS